MVENAGFGAEWAAPIASLMMEKYMYDSISRPELEERMMKGNLIHLINNTQEKKPEDDDAQIIGPSLHDFIPELNMDDWSIGQFEIEENTQDNKKNNQNKENKNLPVSFGELTLNLIYRIEKNEYFS
jgi:hypothetical protein